MQAILDDMSLVVEESVALINFRSSAVDSNIGIRKFNGRYKVGAVNGQLNHPKTNYAKF